MTETLTCAIVGHLVGDYLLQNDWMALNKKRHVFPCLVHAVIWTLSVCWFAEWTNPWAVAALFITHFVQDHTNIVRRWIGQTQFATGVCAPWSVIVVDNVWHIWTIFVVWKALP